MTNETSMRFSDEALLASKTRRTSPHLDALGTKSHVEIVNIAPEAKPYDWANEEVEG